MGVSIGVSCISSTGQTYVAPIQTAHMGSVETTTVWGRIQEAMLASGRPATQVAVAKLLGIKQPSVSLWKIGKTGPTSANLRVVAKKTGFAYEYLQTGRGEKHVNPARPADELLEEFMSIWDKLSVESKRAMLSHAKLMRMIQTTAHPDRVREFHSDLQQANHHLRAKKQPDRR